MEEFKIENFNKENSNKILEFSTLNREDSKWIITNILRLENLSEAIDETQLFYVSIIKSLENEILYQADISMDFLKSVLSSLGVSSDSICFVFWDFDSGIDLFTVQNLLDNWDYIWYDTSDEAIVLYFSGSSKLMLVTDQDFVKTN